MKFSLSLNLVSVVWITTKVSASSSSSSSSSSSLSEKDFRVEGLEDVEPAFSSFEGSMFAGLLPIDPDREADDIDNGNLMFWMFEPDAPTVDDSLVIWFNGGPGCSSVDAGMLFEMGPVTTPLHPAGYYDPEEGITAPLQPNPYAWSNATTIMYVEQPVGVGFSYGAKEPETEADVAADFYHFMQHFYRVFPRHAKKRLYLVGESYAGMYVPAIAHYMYLQNEQLGTKKHHADIPINLGGIGIGNGWIDAMKQSPAVIEYAYWHGMIDSVSRDAFRAEWENCIQNTKQPEPFHPFTVPDECGIMPALLQAAGSGLLPPSRPNEYDVTTWSAYEVLTDDDSTFARFYNDPAVRKALNIPERDDKRWHGCMPGEGRRRRLQGKLLDNDEPVSMAHYISDLLDKAQIDVLIYNGDRDLSTCSQGSEAVLDGMDWSGHEQWLDPNEYHRGLWMVDGQVGGYAKSVQNLQFLIVTNSGHMVPFNQPIRALDLITRLVQGKPDYVDKTIPVVYQVEGTQQSKEATTADLWEGHGLTPGMSGILGFLLGSFTVMACLAIHRYCCHDGKKHQYEQVRGVQM